MRSHRVTIVRSVALALCYGAFVLGYGGSGEPLTDAEVDAHLGIPEGQLGNNAGLNAAALERIRAFAKRDDDKPFFMLNLLQW